MNRSRAAIGTAVLTSAVTSLAMLAAAPTASAAPTADTIATGLIGPLQLDIGLLDGQPRVVVAESFAGLLSEFKEGSEKEVLHAEKGAEISGVAVEGKRVAFLTTKNGKGSRKNPGAFLKVLKRDGSVRTVANLYEYEASQNPDADKRYGLRGLTDRCESKVPEGPVQGPYKGIIESHPYALADAPGGGWFVADAAGNTILKVTPKGNVETVAVLRPQRTVVTQEAAEANKLPKCTVGKTVKFESVPTDVEVGEDGQLIVSLLPGGPEDPSFGARGKVIELDPVSGRTTRIAKGFASATNVAITDGTILVSELFGNRITEIDGDEMRTYHEAPTPSAVEYWEGYVVAAVDVFNPEGGELIVFSPEPALE